MGNMPFGEYLKFLEVVTSLHRATLWQDWRQLLCENTRDSFILNPVEMDTW